MKGRLLPTLAACCLAGAATPAEAKTRPREVKAQPAESYEKAKATCDALALDIAHQVTQKAMADTNVYKAFDDCMARHGHPKSP